jgi:hypothetical protein
MEPVETKLAEWKTIYDQLLNAKARRDSAFNARGKVKGTARQLDELDAEVTRLQAANDAALHALYQAANGTAG